MATYHWIKIFESEQELYNHVQLNTLLVMELLGEKICLARSSRGVYAVQDRCPHNGASLSKGHCSPQNEIICPLHRYSFDLGSGKATSGGAYALKTYPLKMQNDGVFLGIRSRWWEF